MPRSQATLVVIEFGATWPRWLNPGVVGNTAVVAQHYEGPPESLITQVESRVGRLLDAGWRIDEVMLVSNGRTDLESLSARSFLGRELLAFLRAMDGVRLLLNVEPALGRRACDTLQSLARTLQSPSFAHGIAVGIQLGDRAPSYAQPLRDAL